MIISNLVWFWVLFVEGISQQCIPVISIAPSEIAVNGVTEIVCSIGSGTECNNVAALEFHKRPVYSERKDPWLAFKLYENGTEVYFTSDDGYTLDSRSTSRKIFGDFKLTITTSILEDSGDWQCVYIDQNESSIPGTNSELIVSGPPENIEVKGPSGNIFLFGTEYEYTCILSHVYPEVVPTWTVGDHVYNNGTQRLEMDGYKLNIENRNELIAESYNDLNVTCSADKSGTIEWTKEATFIVDLNKVKTPAHIEKSNNDMIEVNIDSTLTIFCTASGADVKIRWFKDETELLFPNSLFNKEEEVVSGNFKYGQTEAVNSTLTWKPPPSSSSAMCDDKTVHVGSYSCEVTGLESSIDTSPLVQVKFVHINGCFSVVGVVFLTLGMVAVVIGISCLIVHFTCGFPCCDTKGNSGKSM